MIAALRAAEAPPVARARVPVYLHPGQLLVSASPRAVSTILGSCVAVCLYDPRREVGGINHFLLPTHAGDARPSPRFGDVAMRTLLEDVLSRGARREHLRAGVYGGACVLEAFRSGAGHLGERNAEVALEFLYAQRILVERDETGGTRGRKLVFHTDDGTTLVKTI